MIDDFYKSYGLRVHEIPVGKKCPIEKGWPNSSRSYDEVERQLESGRFNKYGWILDDNHVVIDIDTHDPKANGYDSLSRLESVIGFSLKEYCGAIVNSPSGGKHFYFSKAPSDTFGKSFSKIYPGIDFISGRGKQVVAAGSFHDSFPGVYSISGRELCPIPQALLSHLKQISGSDLSPPVSTREDGRSGDEYNTTERGLRHLLGSMESSGYTIRNAGEYYEFDRPGKTTSSKCSGHIGKKSKEGNYQLICFSLSDQFFPSGESMTIFHAFALLCHDGDHKKAACELFDAGFSVELYPEIDISRLLEAAMEIDDLDDEEYIGACIPDSGLLRDVFDYYSVLAHRKSFVMGLAVAISFCEVLFGRRVASHTSLRTNDYNVIIAPTNSGKEACEKTIVKIFEAVDPELRSIIPPDVQSGNGLIKALAERRSAIWISDEFGKILASILDKKARNPHLSAIATHLLKMYGKADTTYLGSAHAAGTQNAINQPHLCVLGLTTGSTLFESTTASNVSDGLFGRIAFWPIQERPRRKRMRSQPVPVPLVEKTATWLHWFPGGNLSCENPQPVVIEMTPRSMERWEHHQDLIDERMESENELRSAIWGRVAARSMKLALVHRVARVANPEEQDWSAVLIEEQDINWGIRVANWLARVCCQLVLENFHNDGLWKVKKTIVEAVASKGEIESRAIKRAHRSIASNDVEAAAIELESDGKIAIRKEKTGGRDKTFYVQV